MFGYRNSITVRETITQQTRSFDATNDTTFSIRDKEDANDYRYFADPDLAPFHLTNEFVATIQQRLPALPQQLKQQFIAEFGLSDYDAAQICDDKSTADYFLQTSATSKSYKAIVNWMTGPLRQYVNEQNSSFETIELRPEILAQLIAIVDEGKVNFSIASAKVLPVLMKENKLPLQVAEELNLIQVSDSNELENWINQAIASMPDKVAEYKKGKKGLIGLFVGEVKKLSKGKADPKMVTELLQSKLQ
ncbi:MAG: hypothetical protein MUE72_00630 [Chitinophagaceae bacterium]|nr:hypothetical protein [Chitinophagaceae bacterium]